MAFLFATAALAAAPAAQKFGFDDQKPGEAPRGFRCDRSGRGRAGVWQIAADGTAPSAPNVLAQLDDDATSYRFPVCVVEGSSAKDVDLAVRFKPVKGSGDQAAGLVWRYRDADNYYVVRANALEDNVVLYKVEKGKRSDLRPKGSGLFAYGRKAAVPSGSWGRLRVVVTGDLFEVHYGDQKLFEVQDTTFSDAGAVGVWTKADSVTYFDDLQIGIR